jgi:hypothetical protein
MKRHIAIFAMLPVLVLAQEPKGPVHDLSELPTLQGTQDALRGDITKENEAKRALPFSLTVEGIDRRFVSVHLSVTKTNQLADLSDVFLQSEGVFPSTWIPVSPLRQSTTNAVYFLHLPLHVAKDGLLVLACGKDEHRSVPPKHPDVFVRMLYDKRYTIRLWSYVPMMSLVPDLPQKKEDGKEPEEDEININIEL